MIKLLLLGALPILLVHALLDPGGESVREITPTIPAAVKIPVDSTLERFVGDWTMIDPREGGYPTSSEEARAIDLDALWVFFRFDPDYTVTRSVEIAWGRTDSVRGRWSVSHDTLVIDYPSPDIDRSGRFRMSGDTMFVTRLPAQDSGGTARLLRGIRSYDEMHPEVVVDTYAKVDFAYPRSQRPSRHRNYNMIFTQKSMADVMRFEKGAGGRREAATPFVLNEYLYPYMASYTMSQPVWFRRRDVFGEINDVLYMVSLPDSMVRGIYHELAAVGYDTSPARTARQTNALFDRVLDYMSDTLGAPDSLDAAPVANFYADVGYTRWYRNAYWQDGGREATLWMAVGGQPSSQVRASIYWR